MLACQGAVSIHKTSHLHTAIENLTVDYDKTNSKRAPPVEHAIEHNTTATPEVSLSVTETDRDEVEFTASDSGTGTPEVEQQVLEAGDESPIIHGQGLGLCIAYWLVQLSGGTLSFDSDDTGTKISIRVPTGVSGN